jgi:hypothetical protein
LATIHAYHLDIRKATEKKYMILSLDGFAKCKVAASASMLVEPEIDILKINDCGTTAIVLQYH